MKVLLTGATGFLGSWIARELVGAHHDVRALLRPTADTQNIADLPLDRVPGDLLDPHSVRRALEGCDAVVHTAGATSFLPKDRLNLQRVNVEGTRVVLANALAARVKRAVYTSSVAALGGTRTPRVMDEDHPGDVPPEQAAAYMASKRAGEAVATDLARQGLPVVILSPAVVLGPGDIYRSSTAPVLAIARGRLPGYVPGGAAFTDVRDVARAHLAALDRGTPGERYILGGSNLDIGEYVTRVARIAGVKPPRRIPYPLAWLVALLHEWTGGTLSRDLIRASALFTWVSSEKACRDLGYATRPFDDSVRDTLRFFVDMGKLADLHQRHRSDG